MAENSLSMTDVFPSADELLPDNIRRLLNAPILGQIRSRYAILGPKYVTDKITDGRKTNACMFNSSAKDANEEIIDAIFNVCVLAFKGEYRPKLLRDLVKIWTELETLA